MLVLYVSLICESVILSYMNFTCGYGVSPFLGLRIDVFVGRGKQSVDLSLETVGVTVTSTTDDYRDIIHRALPGRTVLSHSGSLLPGVAGGALQVMGHLVCGVSLDFSVVPHVLTMESTLEDPDVEGEIGAFHGDIFPYDLPNPNGCSPRLTIACDTRG